MKLKDCLFAYGSLNEREKFLTALRITNQRYTRGIPNLSTILYAIMEDHFEERIFNAHQREVLSGNSISKELAMEMKEFFLMVLEDDKLLVDFLNKKISSRYWRREQAKGRTTNETQSAVDIIVKTNLGAFLAD